MLGSECSFIYKRYEKKSFISILLLECNYIQSSMCTLFHTVHDCFWPAWSLWLGKILKLRLSFGMSPKDLLDPATLIFPRLAQMTLLAFHDIICTTINFKILYVNYICLCAHWLLCELCQGVLIYICIPSVDLKCWIVSGMN